MQARAAGAAPLLRWLHAIVVHRVGWDPDIAAGHRPHQHAGARPAVETDEVISAA